MKKILFFIINYYSCKMINDTKKNEKIEYNEFKYHCHKDYPKNHRCSFNCIIKEMWKDHPVVSIFVIIVLIIGITLMIREKVLLKQLIKLNKKETLIYDLKHENYSLQLKINNNKKFQLLLNRNQQEYKPFQIYSYQMQYIINNQLIDDVFKDSIKNDYNNFATIQERDLGPSDRDIVNSIIDNNKNHYLYNLFVTANNRTTEFMGYKYYFYKKKKEQSLFFS